MSLARRLDLACMKNNVLVKAEHIPGKYNILPDLLSRSQVERFKSLAPHMDQTATQISDHLLKVT